MSRKTRAARPAKHSVAATADPAASDSSTSIARLFAAADALLNSEDLDLNGVITEETVELRDALNESLAAARSEHSKMIASFEEIGREAIAAFDEDSSDAEASALKSALDTCRIYVPTLPPDNDNWAI
jgi:hypothetical protein